MPFFKIKAGAGRGGGSGGGFGGSIEPPKLKQLTSKTSKIFSVKEHNYSSFPGKDIHVSNKTP